MRPTHSMTTSAEILRMIQATQRKNGRECAVRQQLPEGHASSRDLPRVDQHPAPREPLPRQNSRNPDKWILASTSQGNLPSMIGRPPAPWSMCLITTQSSSGVHAAIPTNFDVPLRFGVLRREVPPRFEDQKYVTFHTNFANAPNNAAPPGPRPAPLSERHLHLMLKGPISCTLPDHPPFEFRIGICRHIYSKLPSACPPIHMT
jgi:hypothetical protein